MTSTLIVLLMTLFCPTRWFLVVRSLLRPIAPTCCYQEMRCTLQFWSQKVFLYMDLGLLTRWYNLPSAILVNWKCIICSHLVLDDWTFSCTLYVNRSHLCYVYHFLFYELFPVLFCSGICFRDCSWIEGPR